MNELQLPQGYRAKVPRNSWYSFNRTRKDERSHPERPRDFELEYPGLGIQSLNHLTIASLLYLMSGQEDAKRV